jgi:peptidoglycan/xylan/chitin deacetylase (PgdA/CDA1 family)
MRRTVAAYILLASLLGMGTAGAAECPPDALGVSRTIVVDPNEHPRVGSFQYSESLPLMDHEVVLTFDDGPLPPYTNRILDTLASECVKATFFMVGRMVQGYPAVVRRVYNEGHTIANHSQTHPFTFHKMTVERAAQEIEGGFASLNSALGDPKAVAPFFRFPGLLRQDSVERYLAAQHDMAWSVDFLADDWTHIRSEEVARRAINRIAARGKGILLLHDIQPATALALPTILKELKARGFKIVHVVPSTPDRPKTVAEPELWATRRAPEPKMWPRMLPVGTESPQPALAAPSPASFGIESFGSGARLAMSQTFERAAAATVAWPEQVAFAVPPETDVLPIPGAHIFKYSRVFRLESPDKPKVAAKKATVRTAPRPRAPAYGAWFGASPAPTRSPRTVGHQLTVARPPANAAAPQLR